MRTNDQRVALVTGGASGIGKATARALAERGMCVVLLGRELTALETAAEELRRSTGSGDIEVLPADLGSMQSVRAAAAAYRTRHESLHVLVNCAGISLARRQVTVDGFETTFAVNHLGHFLLTALLLDLLRNSAPARIVNVTSSGHAFGRIHFDDLHLERGYGGLKAYSQSKLANVLFTYELARRLEGSGVTANCVHPGIVATPMNKRERSLLLFRLCWWACGWWWMLTPEEGARTVVHLASAPEAAEVSGKYLVSGRPARSSPASHDIDVAKRLWEVSVELTGTAAQMA